jgi:hypothetical protein
MEQKKIDPVLPVLFKTSRLFGSFGSMLFFISLLLVISSVFSKIEHDFLFGCSLLFSALAEMTVCGLVIEIGRNPDLFFKYEKEKKKIEKGTNGAIIFMFISMVFAFFYGKNILNGPLLVSAIISVVVGFLFYLVYFYSRYYLWKA